MRNFVPLIENMFLQNELLSRKGPSKNSYWKVWLVAADCSLIGLSPILVHLSKNSQDKYSYHPLSVSVLIELAKTSFAATVLLIYNCVQGTGRPGAPIFRSARSFIRDGRLNRALAVPAFLYSINGQLKFAMQLFFKPTTAKMLGNLKVLVIAVLMSLVLRRKFSILQWEALLLLCVGITVNQLDYCSGAGFVVPPAAVLCTAASLLVPSLASIFNEWALKRQLDTSVHLQNFYLYFYGLCFNLIGLGFVSLWQVRSLASLFAGHNKYTLILIINSALQGVLSSFFYKYADTLLKKYSSTIATIFTALVSAALFGHHLTLNFLLAVITVFCSMHIFFSQGGSKGMEGGGKSIADSISSSEAGALGRGNAAMSALEASLADPESLHLLSSRRTALLPR